MKFNHQQENPPRENPGGVQKKETKKRKTTSLSLRGNCISGVLDLSLGRYGATRETHQMEIWGEWIHLLSSRYIIWKKKDKNSTPWVCVKVSSSSGIIANWSPGQKGNHACIWDPLTAVTVSMGSPGGLRTLWSREGFFYLSLEQGSRAGLVWLVLVDQTKQGETGNLLAKEAQAFSEDISLMDVMEAMEVMLESILRYNKAKWKAPVVLNAVILQMDCNWMKISVLSKSNRREITKDL